MHPSAQFAQKPPAGAWDRLADVGVIWDTRLLPRPAQWCCGAQSLSYGLSRCQADTGKQTDKGQGSRFCHQPSYCTLHLKTGGSTDSATLQPLYQIWGNSLKSLLFFSSFYLLFSVFTAAGSCNNLSNSAHTCEHLYSICLTEDINLKSLIFKFFKI